MVLHDTRVPRLTCVRPFNFVQLPAPAMKILRGVKLVVRTRAMNVFRIRTILLSGYNVIYL